MARTPLLNSLKRALTAANFSLNSAGTGQIISAEDSYDYLSEIARISRRDFLKGALVGGALTLLPNMAGCATNRMFRGTGANIAVIGAGIGGLTCAFRLRQAGVFADIFEASNRVGGRIFSARDKYPNSQVAELGGELIDSNHIAMQSLALELNIQLDDLFANEPAGFVRDSWYFAGRHVTEREIVGAFRPLASRMAHAVSVTDGNDEAFAKLDQMSITEWLDSIDELSPLLKRILVEAYTGEYGLEASEQSVFNLLYLIDYNEPEPFRIFGDSDERFHVHTGNDTITTRLGEVLSSQLQTGSVVEEISELRDGRIKLSLQRDSGRFEGVYDHVVCAIPFTLLRKVKLNLALTPEKKRVIEELSYGTNAKLMLGFSERVWNTHHNSGGAAITDNGLQFIWDTSRGQSGASGILTNFIGGQAGVTLGKGTAEEQARAALTLINQIFPGTSAKYIPDSAIRMHWPTHPWTLGSYTCYRPGQWSFSGIEGQRVGNLHFCGEHCSVDFQGFMEGGCETGAAAAQEILTDLNSTKPQTQVRMV